MKTNNYKEIEAKEFLKLQDLKGEENFIEGRFVGTEQLQYSPAYIIENTDGGIHKIIGTTDLINKMKKVPIGTSIIIGLKEERVTKSQKPFLVAFVGIIDQAESQSFQIASNN